MRVRSLLWLIARAFKSAFQDNCFNIAKGAAFSSTLSLFPILLIVAALLFRGDATDTVEDLSAALGQVLPPRVHRLLAQYLTVPSEQSAQWLIGAGTVAVLASSQWMISLMEGFRACYGLPRTWSFWKEQGVAIGLVFLVAIPFTLASGLLVFGRQLESWLALELGQPYWLSFLSRLFRLVLAITTITLALGMLYHMGTGRQQSWNWVWPGALFATLLWLVFTLAFAFYVQNLARYGDLYGGVASMVVLLTWLYLVNCIVMLGCEFNAERDRLRAALAWKTSPAEAEEAPAPPPPVPGV